MLGYIFEKYVNQKQMGAYYTKEDITGYISRNTVIPFLFDAARKECPVAFGPDGGVWRSTAVTTRIATSTPPSAMASHGTPGSRKTPYVLKRPSTCLRTLPQAYCERVQARWLERPGAGRLRTAHRDLARDRRPPSRDTKRCGPSSHGWRCRRRLNDLITLNLDIERFALDVISQSEGTGAAARLLARPHGNRERSDTGISVLDPTCGSGAFLFAALNILEPLYTACLEGMRGFLDDEERTQSAVQP